jgi:PKD repeat protein
MRQRLVALAAAVAGAAVAAGCGPPPNASFVVSPAGRHFTGDVLTFSLENKCRRSALIETSWDLDGNGSYETVLGNCYRNPDVQYSYDRPGTYTVHSDFYYLDLGTLGVFLHGYSSQDVVIEPRPAPGPPANQAPTADFSSDASPGYTERPVHFDASNSSDPDGRIVTYEWDFTSDGSWDATGVTASHAFTPAGTYQTTLRVTDDKGSTATTVRAVPVVDGVPPGGLARAAAVTAARSGTPFSTTLSGGVTSTGDAFINGRTLSAIGLAARGTMKLKGLPKPLERKRKARWSAAFTTKQRGNDAHATLAAEGFMLLDFGHKDRVCFSGQVSGSLDRSFTGRLGVVGGSGLGSRLRGGASIAVPLKGATVTGKLNLAKTKAARGLPKACRSLVRGLRAR